MRRIKLIKNSCGTYVLRKPSPFTPAVIILIALITVCGCTGSYDHNSGMPPDMERIRGDRFAALKTYSPNNITGVGGSCNVRPPAT